MNLKNAVRLMLLLSVLGLGACRGRLRCVASAPGVADVADGK